MPISRCDDPATPIGGRVAVPTIGERRPAGRRERPHHDRVADLLVQLRRVAAPSTT